MYISHSWRTDEENILRTWFFLKKLSSCLETAVIWQRFFVSCIGLLYLSNIIQYPSQPGLVQRQDGKYKAWFGRVMEKTPLKHPHPENITAATTSCHSCAGGTLLGIQISDQAGEVSLKHSLKVQGSEIGVHCPAIFCGCWVCRVKSHLPETCLLWFVWRGRTKNNLYFFRFLPKRTRGHVLKGCHFLTVAKSSVPWAGRSKHCPLA